jgi:anti-sigma factor RsiW
MMKCSDELVQLYVEGSLERPAAIIVEEHLRSCHACRHAAARYKELFWDLSHDPGLGADSPIDAEELAAQLCAEARRGVESGPDAHPALIWLVANPAVARPAHAAGKAGKATLSGLARVGRSGLQGLGRYIGRRIRDGKGGGRR